GDDVREHTAARAVAESTITKLSAVRECSVHRGQGPLQGEEDPAVLGRALEMDFVLDGSIRCEGTIGRVSARLLSAADGMVHGRTRWKSPAPIPSHSKTRSPTSLPACLRLS